MSNFLEDPRLRQRWNQISHDAETATENAVAGIWTIQHDYVGPCFGSVAAALDACASLCLGDHEERARRRRERERGAHESRGSIEYSFDFYDDWYADFGDSRNGDNNHDHEDRHNSGGSSTLLGKWNSVDWDRLLAGTGSVRRHGGGGGSGGDDGAYFDEDGRTASTHLVSSLGSGEITRQPGIQKRMDYGSTTQATTNEHRHGQRDHRRQKSTLDQDSTVIPRTQPLGFLARLPFKLGGTLRYKPSAADLQDHPNNRHPAGMESQPLLGGSHEDSDDMSEYDDYQHFRRHGQSRGMRSNLHHGTDNYQAQDADPRAQRHHPRAIPPSRKRSNTTGSGGTSDSYRSRGDLFPSDGEGEEDAVPLDDEFTFALGRVATGDDRSSYRTRRSSRRPVSSIHSNSGGLIHGYGSRENVPRTVSRTTIASDMSSNDNASSRRRSLVSFDEGPSHSMHLQNVDHATSSSEIDGDYSIDETGIIQEEMEGREGGGAKEDNVQIQELGAFMVSSHQQDHHLHAVHDQPLSIPRERTGHTSVSTTTIPIDPAALTTASHDAAMEYRKENASKAGTAVDEESFVPARLPYFG